MIIELLLPSILAGVFIAVSGGALGCFVVWRRMAFFSDTLAHSAILGTVLALIIDIDVIYGLLGYGAVVALVLARFDQKLQVSSDTLLAIIAQASLALGILLLPFAATAINIEALLFGDILAIGWREVIITATIGLAILFSLCLTWQSLLTLSINEDLAATEGIAVTQYKALLFLLLAALVAVAVQIVGVLLVSALVLIPAATARRLVHTPLQMLMVAPMIGVVSVLLGFFAAYQLNTAAGPSIVIVATVIWLLGYRKYQI